MRRIKQWFIHKWDWLVDKYYAWKIKRMNKKNKNKDPLSTSSMVERITKMKNEFQIGIFEVLKNLLKGNSVVLAVIYTLGHICIAMTVVSLLTGASIWEAGLVALVEPTINGFWFYILHSLWKKYNT